MSDLLGERVSRILTVDDDATTRAFLRTSLEDAGLEVIEASGGEEAIRLFSACPPELVLLDVAMPDLDGFATCAALRALPGGRNVPIVMLTGSDDLGAITRAYEAGATDFEVKSVKWVVLGQRIRYLLRAKWAFDALRASEGRLAAAQRIAKIGHWEWDVASGRHLWSEQTSRLLGADEATAATHEEFLSRVHPDDRATVARAFDEALSASHALSVECRVPTPDAGDLVLHAQAEPVVGSDGQPAGLAGTLQDITERRRAEERIRRLAYFDAQTDLPNRVLFQERVHQAIRDARRCHRLVALLFMDLDHFKRVNDTLGHSAGDLLLSEVAARLNVAVRDSDVLTRSAGCDIESVLARHGGDEFIVCLSGVSRAEDAARVAGRILARLEEPIRLNGPEVFYHREHRHQPLPPGRRRPRDAAQACRRRDVPGEGLGSEQLPLLRSPAEPARLPAALARDAPAPRARARGVRPPLAADRGRAHRSADRRGGADPLESPRDGPGAPR